MNTFFQQLYDWLIANWKTTAAGAVTSLALLLTQYGIDLSPETQAKVTGWLVAAGLALIGLFAKDGDEPPAE